MARKMEVYDNVIPASNSSMAKGLFLLGHYFDKQEYVDHAAQMLNNVTTQMTSYPSGHSNWALLTLYFSEPFYEVAISGTDAKKLKAELDKSYHPNKLYIGSSKESNMPLLENKFVKNESYIYVCRNKTCKLPVKTAKEAAQQLTAN